MDEDTLRRTDEIRGRLLAHTPEEGPPDVDDVQFLLGLVDSLLETNTTLHRRAQRAESVEVTQNTAKIEGLKTELSRSVAAWNRRRGITSDRLRRQRALIGAWKEAALQARALSRQHLADALFADIRNLLFENVPSLEALGEVNEARVRKMAALLLTETLAISGFEDRHRTNSQPPTKDSE